MADLQQPLIPNYLFLEANGQLSYIKPANYEISKTRKYKNDIGKMGYSNVPYLVADKPIKQAVVELGTIAFQISMIFSSFFREISRKGILISKMDFC